MTTPAKKPAAPRAAATKTTPRPAAKAPVRAAAKAAPAAKPVAAAPEYNFTKPYKLLTGVDDSTFCDKVSAHLNAGYTLVGSPALTVVGGKAYAAQAVFKASNVAKKAKPKGKSKKK